MSNRDVKELEKLSKEGLIEVVCNLDKKVTELQNRIDILEEMQRLSNVRHYKPKSEQIETLFDELEVVNTFSETEEETVPVKGYQRKKKKPRLCAKLPASAPIYTVDHTIDAPQSIEKDGIIYERAENRIIDKIASVPAQFVVERHIYPQYKAKECAEVKTVVSFSNQETDALGCSPCFMADVTIKKYDDHLPLYRQSEILERSGITLGRQTLAKWLICWYTQLSKVEEYFEKQMYKMKFLNLDETPLKVLDFKTDGGKISKSSFMFIRQGSTYNEKDRTMKKLISCSYIMTRSAQSLTDAYNRYKSTARVMTDGLQSYNGIEKHCSCWVHAVRDFKNILKDRSEPNAKKVVLLVAQLYEIENKYRSELLDGSIDSESFLNGRKKESIKIIDQLYDFLESLNGKYAKGAFSNAIDYILSRKETLKGYLECIEATPDNNAAERVAKAFATGRGNWLFSKTIDGADTSCFMYSLVESAKVNNLNPLDYLEFIFTFGPSAKTEEELEALLPWNAKLSKLDTIRTARINAQPDSEREDPYVFTGLGRC